MTEALKSAAQESGIEIPDSISLPIAYDGDPPRPGMVAVFSGPARQQIKDPGFASGDTDVTTGRKIHRAQVKSQLP